MCLANLQDLEEEEVAEGQPRATEQIFASSVGFLKTGGG
jgi:hypothetical protein